MVVAGRQARSDRGEGAARDIVSPITEDQPAVPTDAYGRSKLEAEEGLAALGIDWVALRPVLVYGPGVKGNEGFAFKACAVRIEPYTK